MIRKTKRKKEIEIYVIGKPSVEALNEDELDIFVSFLEERVSEYYIQGDK